jgi:hypothetical protein
MKPQVYFRLALLFPYIFWCICALITFALPSQEMPDTWNIILMPIMFYTIGIILWLVPYTILAVGMWIWSRSKSTATLYKAALLTPILLTVFMFLETVLISLPADSVMEFAENAILAIVLMGGFSLVFGYMCVGIALGIFKFLQTKNIIADEMSAPVFGNQSPTLV